eukprot:3245664-Pleurochrysis_carterae.AAC.1
MCSIARSCSSASCASRVCREARPSAPCAFALRRTLRGKVVGHVYLGAVAVSVRPLAASKSPRMTRCGSSSPARAPPDLGF